MQAAGVITVVTRDAPPPEQDLTTLAGRLAWARNEAKLSQEALAEKSGVSQGTIGNIESGARKKPRDLVAIAKALSVSADWLSAGKGSPKVFVLDGQHRLYGYLSTLDLDKVEIKDLDLEAFDTVLVDESHRTQNQEETDLLGAFRKLPVSERQELVRDVMARAEVLEEMVTRYLREKHNVNQFAASGKVAENISPAPDVPPAPSRSRVRGTSVFGELDELPDTRSKKDGRP